MCCWVARSVHAHSVCLVACVVAAPLWNPPPGRRHSRLRGLWWQSLLCHRHQSSLFGVPTGILACLRGSHFEPSTDSELLHQSGVLHVFGVPMPGPLAVLLVTRGGGRLEGEQPLALRRTSLARPACCDSECSERFNHKVRDDKKLEHEPDSECNSYATVYPGRPY